MRERGLFTQYSYETCNRPEALRPSSSGEQDWKIVKACLQLPYQHKPTINSNATHSKRTTMQICCKSYWNVPHQWQCLTCNKKWLENEAGDSTAKQTTLTNEQQETASRHRKCVPDSGTNTVPKPMTKDR